MFENIKTIKLNTEQLSASAQKLGWVMMATAATVGLVEFADHKNGREALVPQAALITDQQGQGSHDNSLRRERDEAGPHYTSYASVQRTPGRTRYYA